ncbi:hypothetical protein NDS46_30260 (plasmid) [Paenibacillus thiaminolyticus]|uniref:hypothetical protein n=1 Tax=Paenibacillus thiaminolyticus TaxID=49283 RepID=UPI00232C902D|nr:hypothetical protein [Paenibacillus thiaminolyticus]WCF11632.1 hypothetical protein NDS46_30260 [Paenibacillus thiaminolyticus]
MKKANLSSVETYSQIQTSMTRSQRDAFYFGHVLGVELASKQYGIKVRTDLLGEVLNTDQFEIQRRINLFFLQKGFALKDKSYFHQGIQIGIKQISQQTKEKAST